MLSSEQVESTSALSYPQITSFLRLCDVSIDVDALIDDVETANGISAEQLAAAEAAAEEAANDPGVLFFTGEHQAVTSARRLRHTL